MVSPKAPVSFPVDAGRDGDSGGHSGFPHEVPVMSFGSAQQFVVFAPKPLGLSVVSQVYLESLSRDFIFGASDAIYELSFFGVVLCLLCGGALDDVLDGGSNVFESGDGHLSHFDSKVDGVSRGPLRGDFAGLSVVVGEEVVKESATVFPGFEGAVGKNAYGLMVGVGVWGRHVFYNGSAVKFLAGEDVINDTGFLLCKLPRPWDASRAEVGK